MPQHSAILPAYGSQSIHATHMGMTKFESAEDPGFVDVSTTLWRWARDLAKEAEVASVVPAASQGRSEGPQTRLRPLAIEDGTLHGEHTWRNINTFGGHNDTGGGRVFQGSIDARGDVSIN